MRLEKMFLIAVSLSILLGTSFMTLIPVGGIEIATDTPTALTTVTTDYVVNNGEVKSIDNEQWIMEADIEVYGTLYINSTHILWGGTSDGQFGLYVHPSGTLYMKDNCNFTANDTSTHVVKPGGIPWNETWGIHWKFEIEGSARIENSNLSYMWGANGNYLQDARGGIQCYSDNILIQNVTIFNSEQSGISSVDRGGSVAVGYDPVINNVIISNVTGWGLFASGANSNPSVTNLSVYGNPYRGIQYFYGASGRFEWVNIYNCGDLGFTFDPISGGSMTIKNCTFSGNKYGYSARRGGTITMYDSHFDGNKMYGIEMAHDSGYSQTVSVMGGTVKDNEKDGIGTSHTQCSASFSNVEIAYNNGNGIFIGGGSSISAQIDGCKIYNNGQYGIYSNGSGGSVSGTNIYSNPSGGIFSANGSTISIRNCNINNTGTGVSVSSSSPAITENVFAQNDIGVILPSGSASVSGNEFQSNGRGLVVSTDGITIQQNNFTSSTYTALEIENADQFVLRKCNFNNNPVAIHITGGDFTDLRNLTIRGSTGAGIKCEGGANFTLMQATVVNNAKDVELDGASIGKVYEIPIPIGNVNIIDADSEFWQFWRISIIVTDNVTFLPVYPANVVIYGGNGEEIMNEWTIMDGSSVAYVPSYKIIGQTTYDYNPINLTVSKDGYVPYWGGNETFDGNIDREILLSENRLPEFPLPPAHAPNQTHQNRPSLTWSEAWDWNNDVIKYRLNVYMDELYSGDHIVEDVIIREPSYTFTKNLRYNKIYWAEVESFDPWGLNDTIIFSFRTINTPPTTPEVAFLSTPVSTLDNITVVILNGSTDMDVDPVDRVSYLMGWYVYREESWVLIASGINMTELSSEETSEGDHIKVVVKPYDGIEYGNSAELELQVVNFVPSALQKFVDMSINEDEQGIDLVDLKSLFFDRDGDELSFRVERERHVSAVIDQVSNNVTFIPDPNWIGTDQVIIQAFDTKQHEESWPTITINITVISVNDPPSIDLVNDEPVGQGETMLIQSLQGSNAVITIGASDPDEIYGDTFTFSTNFLEVVGEGVVPEDDFQFETNSGRLSVFLSNALVGEILFNITATDEGGASSTVPIRLIVENVNDPPTKPEILEPEEGVEIVQPENGMIRFRANESDDPDLHIPNSEETLQYSWDFGDGSDPLTNAGTTVEHEFLVDGEYTVTVTVQDSMGMTRSDSMKVKVNVTEVQPQISSVLEGKTFLEEYSLILILVVVGILFLLLILFFVLKRDPLSKTAEEEEKEQEALVARQQQEALEAQEKLQALISGTGYGIAGPALPSAGAEGAGLEALPAASEPIPGQEPPMEAYPEQPVYDQAPVYDQPPVEQPPLQEPMMEQPAYQPAPPTIPEEAPQPAPMQAAPVGTVPVQETPQAQNNLPPPEEQQ